MPVPVPLGVEVVEGNPPPPPPLVFLSAPSIIVSNGDCADSVLISAPVALSYVVLEPSGFVTVVVPVSSATTNGVPVVGTSVLVLSNSTVTPAVGAYAFCTSSF